MNKLSQTSVGLASLSLSPKFASGHLFLLQVERELGGRALGREKRELS